MGEDCLVGAQTDFSAGDNAHEAAIGKTHTVLQGAFLAQCVEQVGCVASIASRFIGSVFELVQILDDFKRDEEGSILEMGESLRVKEQDIGVNEVGLGHIPSKKRDFLRFFPSLRFHFGDFPLQYCNATFVVWQSHSLQSPDFAQCTSHFPMENNCVLTGGRC